MTASYKENTQTPAANASASNVGTTQSNIPDDKIYTGLLFKDDHPTNEFPVSIQAFATPTAKTALLNGHSLAGDGLDRLGHMVHRRIVAHPSRLSPEPTLTYKIAELKIGSREQRMVLKGISTHATQKLETHHFRSPVLLT
jgi:hypothetical protein